MNIIKHATLVLLLALAAGFMASAQDMSMSDATLTLGEHEVFGEYLADGDGRALYVVVDEDGQPVDCAGECAEAWPPFLVEGTMAGEGSMAGEDGMEGDGEMAGDESMSGDGEMAGESGMQDDGDMAVDESMSDDGDMGGQESMADDDAMAGDVVTGEGVDPSLVGKVERADGSMQWTYDDRPLYYFVNDVEAGEVNCQAVAQFGGTWYVLYGDGEINRSTP